ncbi:insulin-degrading enzyme-like [Clytia hemisphaerica]|eukprot:TCONS_00071355-protein
MVACETVIHPSDSMKYFNVVKSENDPRSYRLVELKNSIKILLISDPIADKAAASVDVNIGHLVDPDDVPGIAHFCEHMLFLGTEKYPIENSFSEFVAQNAGYPNASTGPEHTNYHFEVKCSALDEALDRFSQFFIGPLFNQDSTNRELNAIDSEHKKNVLNDPRRLHYIDKVTCKKGHVYRKFGTGSLETLQTIPEKNGTNIRDLLLKFHKQYYSANIMSVAVLGKETLDELEKMVTPKFEEIVNKNVEVPVYSDHPFGSSQLGTVINIKSVKKMKLLEMKFPLSDYRKYYKEKPSHYLSHLIGHEGPGSILSYLKKQSWVHALSAGEEGGAKGFSFFVIAVELSEEGLKHTNEIISLIFEYIELLKSHEPSEKIFNELKLLEEIRFKFKDKSSPRPYVTNCSKKLSKYDPEEILIGPYMMTNFRPDLIKDILSRLRPDNFRYMLVTQDGRPKLEYQTVDHYGAEYNVSQIPQNYIDEWRKVTISDKFRLPHENPFIPESLDVKVAKSEAEEKNVPQLIKDTNMMRVWYKADDTFVLPKSCIDIHLYSPMSSLTPAHAAHLRLFIGLLEEEMNEYLYDAALAGISGTHAGTDMGVIFMLSGYNDKQPLYLEYILNKLITLPLKQDKFDLQMEIIEESLKNFESLQPYQQMSSLANHVLEERYWTTEEILQSLKDVNLTTLKEFVPAFLRNIYIECLFTGNLLEHEAIQISESIEQVLISKNHACPMLPIQHMMSREYELPEGCCYLIENRNEIHEMSCILVYFQVGLMETRTNVLCELFSTMIKEPFFDTLRTKEQLGYLTFSGLGRSSSVQGLRYLIQTDKSPAMVEERINDFLKSYEETLKEMNQKTFDDYVDSLAVRKLDKPKLLKQESQRYWAEILSKQYHFRRGQFEVEELKKLTLKDVTEFYKKYISPSSEHRKKVAFVILGKDAESCLKSSTDSLTPWSLINNVISFKTQLPLYPLLLPFNNIPLIGGTTKSRL